MAKSTRSVAAGIFETGFAAISLARREERPGGHCLMISRTMMQRALLRLGWAGLLAALVAPASAELVPIDGDGWTLSGDVAREEYQGREALRIGTGKALQPGVSLTDGTIDVDVVLPDGRSFVYLLFRMADAENHEEIYLRPHKSHLPDALQYSAVFHGVSGWQLYHGPGATAAAELPRGEWVHLRLVVQGARAALFVGNSDLPALTMGRLARGGDGGFVGLRCFLPRGTEASHGAFFANLDVSPGVVPYDLSTIEVTPAPADVVTSWEISRPVAAGDTPPEELPDDLAAQWRSVATEPSGVLNLDRHVERPSRNALIYARLRLEAERTTLQKIELGASDIATVFLDGRPIVSTDASYRFDQPRRQGVLNLDRTLFLPLERGPNEVVIAISDVFGGWGLIGRLRPLPGVRILRR